MPVEERIKSLEYNPDEDHSDTYPYSIDLTSFDSPLEPDQRALKILEKFERHRTQLKENCVQIGSHLNQSFKRKGLVAEESAKRVVHDLQRKFCNLIVRKGFQSKVRERQKEAGGVNGGRTSTYYHFNGEVSTIGVKRQASGVYEQQNGQTM